MTTTRSSAMGPGNATPAELLERAGELATIETALDDARRGTGSLVVLEGEAGIGKSALLEQAAAAALERGMQVLAGRGSELERSYPFGVVVDMFGPLLRSAARGAELLTGAAALADPVFRPAAGAGDVEGGDPFAALHGLFWLTVNASERAPLLLVMDDAHWVDDASLRFAHYLAQRITGLHAVLIVAQRPGESAASGDPGGRLRDHRDATLVQPRRLSPEAVTDLLASHGVADADGILARRFWEVSSGNPFFVTELVRTHRAGGTEADGAVPSGVARAIRRRLQRLGPEARALAEAIAILGDGSTLLRAARLAGLDDDTAARTARRMIEAAILGDGEALAFIHPIALEAVRDEMPAATRAHLHREAATLLRREAAPVELVATQLLSAEPAGDSEIVAILRQAARTAVAQGAPAAGAPYLRRALREPPPDAERGAILADLARAEAAVDAADAVHRYDEALAAIGAPLERARLRLELGNTRIAAVQWGAAVDAFKDGLAEVGEADPELRSRLEAGFISAAFVSRSQREAAEELLKGILSSERLDPGHRELAAWVAYERSVAVTAPASEMLALVRRALGDAPIEELVTAGQLVEVCTGVLGITDDLQGDIDLLTRAIAAARRMGVQTKFGTYSYCRSAPLYFAGRLNEALADGQAAQDAAELGWETFYPAACAVMAWALLDYGDVDAAAKIADLDDERWGQRVDHQLLIPIARGRIAMQRGQLDEAIRQFEIGRHAGEATGVRVPVFADWRSWMTTALARAGRRDEAIAVADEHLDLARQWAARWPLGVAHRSAGIARGGDEGIELLRLSVDHLSGGPAQLEHARTLVTLGAALRRAGNRTEARSILAEGRDLAHRLDARTIADRAKDELLAAGARPRRYAVTGVDALTPSELRVARMAAAGRTNREVAEALFVTPKAIEYHLANAYRKLGIGARSELGRALSGAPTPEGASV